MTDLKSRQKNNPKKIVKKSTMIKSGIFLAVSAVVIVWAAYLFVTYEPTPIAQKFFENRKGVAAYNEYRDKDGTKKKAERNIYLQD